MSNDDEDLDFFAEPTAFSFSESSVIYVSNEAYDMLMAELEKPPQVNEKLLAAIKRHDERRAGRGRDDL